MLIEVQGVINDVHCEGVSGYLPVTADGVMKLAISGWLELIPKPLATIFENLNGVLTAPVYWGVIKTESHENGFQISGGSFDIDGKVISIINSHEDMSP